MYGHTETRQNKRKRTIQETGGMHKTHVMFMFGVISDVWYVYVMCVCENLDISIIEYG